MKPLALSALLFMSLACTHVKVIAFDKADNTVSVQGNKRATQDDVQVVADQYCGGHAKLLKMHDRAIGESGSVGGGPYFATANRSAIFGYVYDYVCDKGAGRSEASSHE